MSGSGWTAGTLALCALFAAGCHRGDGDRKVSAAPALTRGDVVVVERAASEFFQARVLAVTDGTLKVQTSEDGEPMVVSRSDAYRVPPPEHAFSANEPAICAERAEHWVPCRVASDERDGIVVHLDSGEEQHLGRAQVIAPSAVTALDIERHFETVRARSRFDEEARRAGAPPRPSGWIPVRHEPVLAQHGTEWYSAHVREMLEDSGVRLVWDGEGRTEDVSEDRVVPAPPVSRAPVRGEFALSRPSSPSEPWERVKVEGVGPNEAVAVGIDGTKRRLDVRSLIPLVSSNRKE